LSFFRQAFEKTEISGRFSVFLFSFQNHGPPLHRKKVQMNISVPLKRNDFIRIFDKDEFTNI